MDVGIYADRVEIWSLGTLLPGVPLQDLGVKNKSILRNPKIAGVFFRLGTVAQWGSGLRKVVDLVTQAGHPAPIFYSQAAAFGVQFTSKNPIRESAQIEGVTPLEHELLLLLSDEVLTREELMKRFASRQAPRTVQRALASLAEKGFILAHGRARARTYKRLR